MPSLPKHPCGQPGCGDLTSGRYCEAHAHLAVEDERRRDRARASSNARMYDSKWRRYAKAFIARHPLCCYCAAIGRTSATECVDHAIPPRGDWRVFWDKSGHRPACISCNSRKGDRTEAQFLAEITGRQQASVVHPRGG